MHNEKVLKLGAVRDSLDVESCWDQAGINMWPWFQSGDDCRPHRSPAVKRVMSAAVFINIQICNVRATSASTDAIAVLSAPAV